MDEVRLHKCQNCPRKFLNSSGLMIHMKHFHKNEQKIKTKNDQLNTVTEYKCRKPWQCELCNKILCSKYTLKLHMETIHEKKTKFQCHICNRCFAHKASMQYHIDSFHKKLKPHKCKTCNKCFTKEFTLMRHIQKQHEKQRLYNYGKPKQTFGQI